MKRLFIALAAVILLALNVRCQACGMVLKGITADTIGLTWTVTLYDCSGNPIHVWKTRATVNSQGGEAWFRNADGKMVQISGTFTVLED